MLLSTCLKLIQRDYVGYNFVKVNNDPSADPGVRRLSHFLETGEKIDQPFILEKYC